MKIVIFGGTLEGRLLAEAFAGTALELEICVATEYGATLLPQKKNIHVHAGRLDEAEMEAFLGGLSADYCLDATHPYAAAVTQNIAAACQKLGLSYLRILRREGKLEKDEKAAEASKEQIIYCDGMEEAVRYLETTKGNILLTTGSRDLAAYTKLSNYRERCFARVLPTRSVMEKCMELGFEGKNLIGMQGPFSEELNFAMLKQVKAEWIVTKNSGREGGYYEKCEAALRAGARILVIGRPPEQEENGMELPEAIDFLKKRYGMDASSEADSALREVFLVGMGPGDPALLTWQARQCLEQCDLLIGAKRVLEIWPDYDKKPFLISYKKEEIRAYLKERTDWKKAAILYSGDIGFYSGAKGMEELLQEFAVHPVTGLSSPLYFLNRLGIAWEKVQLVSCHGQTCDMVSKIRYHGAVCALLGEKDSVSRICMQLRDAGLLGVRVTVGERLSYPEERIVADSAEAMIGREFDSLSVALFENAAPAKERVSPGIADSAFIRGKVPMTKEEIRSLSLAKLGLKKDSVVYDVGAGTGSVSVEAALLCPEGTVYAIEKKDEAVDLLEENRSRFGVSNMVIVPGSAPEALEGLKVPTHVFIGGSSGKLAEIVSEIREKNRDARFVCNVITLETLAQVMELKEKFPEYEGMEVVQVNIARSRELGRYHLMNAENPVYIVRFGGEA